MQINLVEKESKPFDAKTKEQGQSKKIHKLCNGNYQMYVRRRKPDTLEVQQMKVSFNITCIDITEKCYTIIGFKVTNKFFYDF